MQVHVTAQSDGSILLRMDVEAARATFASVVFASRYNDCVRGLEEIAKHALEDTLESPDRRHATCR